MLNMVIAAHTKFRTGTPLVAKTLFADRAGFEIVGANLAVVASLRRMPADQALLRND